MSADVNESPRPEWAVDEREGFVGVEGRVLIARSDLVVAMLRLAADGRVPDHPASDDVEIACVEGRGWTSIGGVESPLEAGQWTTWPAGVDHGLRTGEDSMTVLIVHPRAEGGRT